MKKLRWVPFIGILLIGVALHLTLGTYLVEELVFADSSSTFFEQVMYQLAVLPPFLIGVFFYKETSSLSKSLTYSGLFYIISAVMINLYHYIPVSSERIPLSSHDFFVTGGGVKELAVGPHLLVTFFLLFAISRYKKYTCS